MSPKITQIQDKFFKSIFSRKEIAIELFEKTLTQNIQTIIDIEKIELVSGSFVSGKLKENFADLVYRCPLFADGEVQIVLLLEHKSYQEDYPHFQLLQYFLNLWKQNIKQKQAPAFIIPIIFYHGKTTWHYQRMQDYFAKTPKQLLHYLPIFDYNLIDLSTMEDSQIEGFKNSFLAVSAFLLKYRHLKNYIKLKEDAFVKLMKKIDINQDEELSESIFVYVQETNNLTKKELFDTFDKVSNQSKSFTMSTIERERNEDRYEAIKNLVSEGIVTDLEKLQRAFKISKKKMDDFMKRMAAEK